MGSDDIFGSGKDSDKQDESSSQEPAEELRYEGPITFDDDEFDDEYDEPAGGKVFLTTVGIAAVVVIIVAVAIWMGRDKGEPGETLAEMSASPPELEQVQTPAEGQQLPAPGELAQTGTEIAEETELGAALDYRAVPDSSPSEDRAQVDADPGPARPDPKQATQKASAPASRPRPQALGEQETLAKVAELASSGQVWAAAELGQRVSPGEDTEWTLQVLFACQPDNVSRAFNKAGDSQLVVYPVTSQGRSCYRLCWGTFQNRSSAEAAIDSVPRYFRDAGIPHPLVNAKAR